MSKRDKFYLALFVGSLLGWAFFSHAPTPILAGPIFLVWLLGRVFYTDEGYQRR